MTYQVINRMDEKGRFIDVNFYEVKDWLSVHPLKLQQESHAYSYIFSRDCRKKIGMKMGLDKIVDTHKVDCANLEGKK